MPHQLNSLKMPRSAIIIQSVKQARVNDNFYRGYGVGSGDILLWVGLGRVRKK